jgi:hypothetical protein
LESETQQSDVTQFVEYGTKLMTYVSKHKDKATDMATDVGSDTIDSILGDMIRPELLK